MKALVTASFSADGLRRLAKHMAVVHEDWREKQHIYLDGAKLAARLREVDADVLIVEADFVFDDAFEGTDLRLIGSCRGDPNNIAMARATDRGIPVLFTPARNADAVADLTLAFLLALLRNVYTVNRLLKSGEMTFKSVEDYLGAYSRYGGVELGGLTVGIVGFGAIGRRVAKRVLAFGSRVLAYDPFLDPETVRGAGAEPLDLDALLRESDVVTLHCPDKPENRGLIDAGRIGMMKPGAFFLNLARAAVVDDDALYAALHDGHLAGGAFDVFAEEPVSCLNRFVQLDNVLVAPHLGGATRDVVEHQSEMMMDDVEAWLEGRRPRFIANPEVLDKP
jgi:D-3-phosphoglycerate dehydrogenase